MFYAFIFFFLNVCLCNGFMLFHCTDLWSFEKFSFINKAGVDQIPSLNYKRPAGGPVFLDEQAAASFMSRSLLYNHWDFELVVPDNLERECREEMCSYEEAREVFEDDVKTVNLLRAPLHL